MSRSRRKTPIVGNSMCRSERPDKEAWHRAFRAKVRSLHDVQGEGTRPHPREVSSPWHFGKDGHHYWSERSQRRVAEFVAKRGATKQEQESLKVRFMAKAMSK